jgi:hypothetical protein
VGINAEVYLCQRTGARPATDPTPVTTAAVSRQARCTAQHPVSSTVGGAGEVIAPNHTSAFQTLRNALRKPTAWTAQSTSKVNGAAQAGHVPDRLVGGVGTRPPGFGVIPARPSSYQRECTVARKAVVDLADASPEVVAQVTQGACLGVGARLLGVPWLPGSRCSPREAERSRRGRPAPP